MYMTQRCSKKKRILFICMTQRCFRIYYIGTLLLTVTLCTPRMTAFPPTKWAVRLIRDLDTMECASLSESGISMEAFMAVKPAGGEEGNFRFVLAGPEKLKLRFNIQAVLSSGLFAGMVAEAEINVGDHVQLVKNSVCTKWINVLELVQSQDMSVVNGLGEDVADEFIAAMAEFKKDQQQESRSCGHVAHNASRPVNQHNLTCLKLCMTPIQLVSL